MACCSGSVIGPFGRRPFSAASVCSRHSHRQRRMRRKSAITTNTVVLPADLRAVGCDLYLHQQGVDTTTPARRALFQMLGVLRKFNAASSSSASAPAGIARARAQGKHLGRPRIDNATYQAVRAAPRRRRRRRAPPCGCPCPRRARLSARRGIARRQSDGRAGLLSCWSSLGCPRGTSRPLPRGPPPKWVPGRAGPTSATCALPTAAGRIRHRAAGAPATTDTTPDSHPLGVAADARFAGCSQESGVRQAADLA